MNNSPNKRDKRVRDVLAFACDYYKPERDPNDAERKAMKRQITRYFKEKLGMSSPYLVTENQMHMIVKVDLRDYFEERLGHEKAAAERKRLRKEVAELRKIEIEEMDNAYKALYEDEPFLYESYEITSDVFQQLMIRAMFRKMFPAFDEATFKAEYEEWNYLRSEWTSCPANLDDEQGARLLQLKKRIDTAVTNGDISAYEHNEDTRQETAKSHG